MAWLSDFCIDLRIAVRLLLKDRPFTAVTIGSLAVGIAANTALFAIISSLILRPLPYERPDHLVQIELPSRSFSLSDLDQATSFTGVAAFIARGLPVTANGEIKNLFGFRVSPNLFSVLGVHAVIGRTFEPGDADNVAVIGYDHWLRLSGKPDVLGQTLIIADKPHTIIGVLPQDFVLSVRDGELWIPYRMTEGRIVGRLKPGVTPAQAAAELTSIANATPANAGRIQVRGLADAVRPDVVSTLLLLQAAVGLVLLITCANAGNLMLVRAVARSKEFAIRSALGAGAARIVRQLLTESALLAALGGALGLLLAKWSLAFLTASLPVNYVRVARGADGISIDHRVILFTAAVSALCSILFGLAPAFQTMRSDLISRLRDSTKSSSPGRRRLGELLVMAEIALALVLLIGVGVTLKSLAGLEKQYLGFSPDHVLRVPIDLLPTRYPRPEQRRAVFQEMTDRVKSLPGVEEVGFVAPQFFPFGGPRVRGSRFQIEGRPDAEARAETYVANPAYFRSVRIPLLRGRFFTDSDNAASEPIAIISDVVAKRYWGAADPLGRRIRLQPDDAGSPFVSIVGVVGDVRNPIGSDWQPTAYRPMAQHEGWGGIFMIRTTGPPMALANTARREFVAADSTGLAFRPGDLEAAVSDYLSPQRFVTSLLGVFALAGLLLAAMGVYGVMRYWVGSRIPEIGIRLALGAERRAILSLVLGQAGRSAVAGIMLGVAGSFALQRFLASQLYGVSPTDPTVIATVCILMGSVALLAAFLPARWASRIDPVDALRQ